jgi:hypothetical protein
LLSCIDGFLSVPGIKPKKTGTAAANETKGKKAHMRPASAIGQIDCNVEFPVEAVTFCGINVMMTGLSRPGKDMGVRTWIRERKTKRVWKQSFESICFSESIKPRHCPARLEAPLYQRPQPMVRSWRIPFLYALGVGLWAWQTS